MAYIQVAKGVPGIRSLVMFRPETGIHLYDLAQILFRGESPLAEAERELIVAYVSLSNNCMFCVIVMQRRHVVYMAMKKILLMKH